MFKSQTQASLNWLVKIRWAALVGQLLVFFVSSLLLKSSLALGPILLVSLFLAVSNLLLLTPAIQKQLQHKKFIFLLLLLDILMLTLVLYAYAGYSNPFSMIYIAHVMLASILLGGYWTWCVSLISFLCYLSLFIFYVPIPELQAAHLHHAGTQGFDLHLQGMLVGFILLAVLVSGFLEKLRFESVSQLRELELRKLNEAKLAAVTSLAASVAHEIGTPLGSLQLISEELKAKLSSATQRLDLVPELADLESQIARCAKSLRKLVNSSGNFMGEVPTLVNLSQLLAQVVLEFEQQSQRFDVRINCSSAAVNLPEAAFKHVIWAVLKNAIEASPENLNIQVALEINTEGLVLAVKDQGLGIPAEIQARIGEPFVSTKEGVGMGLGLFLSKLFMDSLGEELQIKTQPSKGTTISFVFKRFVA